MSRIALPALLLLLLLAPCWAQESSFLERMTVHIQAQDWQGMIAEVQASPEEAEASARSVLELAESSPEKTNLSAASYYANLIARILKLHCQSEGLSLHLSSKGLLKAEDSWAVTPLARAAATASPAKEEMADFMARFSQLNDRFLIVATEMQKRAARLPLLQDRCNFAAQVEDMEAFAKLSPAFFNSSADEMPSLLAEYRELGKEAGQFGLDPDEMLAGVEKLSRQLALIGPTERVLGIRMLGATGLYSQVLAEGEPLLPKLEKLSAKDLKNILLVGMVSAAYRSGLPHKMQALIAKSDSTNPQEQFMFKTSALVLNYQVESDASPERFLKDYESLWPTLEQFKGESLNRPTAQSAQDLISLADEVSRTLVDGSTDRRSLERLVAQSLEELKRLGRLGWDEPALVDGKVNQEWQTFLYFHYLMTRMELAEQAREAGDAEQAKRHLAEVEQALPELRAKKRELQVDADELFRESEVKVDLDRGLFSAIPAQYEEALGRELVARGSRLSAADAEKAVGHFQRAIELYQRAGNFRERILHLIPRYALLLHRSGGNSEEALGMITNSLLESRERGLRRNVIEAQLARGEILAALGREDEAVKDFEEGLKKLEDYTVEFGAQAPASRALTSRSESAYRALATIRAKNNSPEQTLALLSRLELVKAQSSVAPSVDPATTRGQALREVKSRQLRLRSLEKEQSTIRAMSDGGLRQKALATHSRLLANSKAEFYQSLGELYRANPGFERLAIRPVNFARIQKHVPADTLIAQYFPTEDGLYIFLLDRNNLKTRKVDVSLSRLEAQSLSFRRAIKRVEDFESHGFELYSYLIAPIEEELTSKKVLAVIPTGSLLYVPFSALAKPGPDGKPKFLLDRLQTVSLVKSADLDILDESARKDSETKVVAFGNPDGTLSSAVEEVDAIKGLFPTAAVYVGKAANKSVVNKLGEENPSLLHFATHGVLDSGDPQANHLVLAGSDGRLSVNEIAGLDLGENMRLVTLSACQTAMVNESPRSELLQSMADAFGYAGSPSVVASLWSVSDASTKVLMEEFYSQLKLGRSKSEALQRAAQKVHSSKQYSHPFYWAPFVLIGDWR